MTIEKGKVATTLKPYQVSMASYYIVEGGKRKYLGLMNVKLMDALIARFADALKQSTPIL